MSIPLTKRTTDHSDQKGFSFSFFCDLCGKEWRSPVKPFMGGDCTIVEHDEALKLLWANDHRAAFEEANLEAHFHFNNCPQCGKWVCNDCFPVEDKKSDEVCVGCKEG